MELVSPSTAKVFPKEVTTEEICWNLTKLKSCYRTFQEEKIPQVIKEFYDPQNAKMSFLAGEKSF